MSDNKMLIDAAHNEETRVAMIDAQGRLVEYGFESSNKQTIKSNIYLAKVARVEPSLQAAFIEYGGNRHGFLAFSEIHPDYFRIPISDREALSIQLYQSQSSSDADEDKFEEILDIDDEKDGDDLSTTVEFDNSVSTIAGEMIEHIEDEAEEAHRRRPPLHQMYKIQEVIHKNQILLIQVVKEERGQKGAALTTYLSLAGRYCVLMPNSPHAGGISRKVSNPKDRQRLRSTLDALEVPREMGLIIRTAGKDRSRTEIKRDVDYLMRLWGEIREETLQSMAPKLIYQEDNIIKRAIRDFYSKDINDIYVEGEEGYKAAKDFIKKLMPSHAKKVISFKAKAPIFMEYKIEKQIEQMHSPTVHLPSGGSIVIHPTEALVAIDINSGRATRERHIEETALNTNLEAAEEIARQVRLRDLAGLIVIDFIDMDDRRHVASVERRIREAFRDDRARVQMSKISPFGLLELSRQRLRPSILETSSSPCKHCQSTGYVRSTESMALQLLRAFQEEGIAARSARIRAEVPTEVGLYLLNEKRSYLNEIEAQYQMHILIELDASLIVPHYRIIQVSRRGASEDVSKSKETEEVTVAESTGMEKRQDRQPRQVKQPKHERQPSRPAAAKEEGGDDNVAKPGEGRSKRRNRSRKRSRKPLTENPQTQEAISEAVEQAGESGTTVTSPAEMSQAQPVSNEDRADQKSRHRRREKRNRRRQEKGPRQAEETGNSEDDSAQSHAAAPIVLVSAQNLTETSENTGAEQTPTTKRARGGKRRNWLKRLLDAE